MKRKMIVWGLMLFGILLVSGSPGYAADGWEANLLIAQGNLDARLSIGQKPGGTAGIDGLYDVPAMASGTLQGALTDGGKTLWRDIRGITTGSTSWTLEVRTTVPEKALKISWDSRQFPAAARLTFTDGSSGTVVDMRKRLSHSTTGPGIRTFFITVVSP